MEKTKQRVCKNKKCQKPLPDGYKHKYCEACRNNQAHTAKNIGKGALAVLVTAGGLIASAITAGRINPKK